MLDSFSAEMLKLYKRPAMWVLLVVALILSQVFNYLVPYASYLTAENERGDHRGPRSRAVPLRGHGA